MGKKMPPEMRAMAEQMVKKRQFTMDNPPPDEVLQGGPANYARKWSSGTGPGQTEKKITEDDPRWDPKTMGNKRGARMPKGRPMKGAY